DEGRKEGGPSDGPHVLSPPREEHRIRLGPDPIGQARDAAHDRDFCGGARRHCRQEAVRRSEEVDPEIVDRERPWRRFGSLRSKDGSRQAGRAAFGLEGDLLPAIRPDATPGGLEALTGDRVSFEDDAIAAPDREHVRRHRVELLVWDFHEFEPVLSERFPEWDREEAWVDDREVVID